MGELRGNICKQMTQKSPSSSDGGDDFALARLAGGLTGGDAFFFVARVVAAFFGVVVAFFSLREVRLSGEVSTELCIGFRPRFDGFFGVAACRGPISSKIDDELVAQDIAEPGRGVDGADVDGSDVDTSSSRPTSVGQSTMTMRRCSSSVMLSSTAASTAFCSTAWTKSESLKMSGL